MKKVVVTFGLISGAIVSVLMGIAMAIGKSNPDFGHSYVVGYATMLLAFSMIFVGIKMFRDKYNGGFVSIGKAFKIGLYIALIASTMYVIVWAIESHFFYPDFMEKYSAHMVDELKRSGVAQAKIDAQVKQMATMAEWYKNPVFFTLMTYAEILPLGLIVSLISALILRKKDKGTQAIVS